MTSLWWHLTNNICTHTVSIGSCHISDVQEAPSHPLWSCHITWYPFSLSTLHVIILSRRARDFCSIFSPSDNGHSSLLGCFSLFPKTLAFFVCVWSHCCRAQSQHYRDCSIDILQIYSWNDLNQQVMTMKHWSLWVFLKLRKRQMSFRTARGHHLCHLTCSSFADLISVLSLTRKENWFMSEWQWNLWRVIIDLILHAAGVRLCGTSETTRRKTLPSAGFAWWLAWTQEAWCRWCIVHCRL